MTYLERLAQELLALAELPELRDRSGLRETVEEAADVIRDYEAIMAAIDRKKDIGAELARLLYAEEFNPPIPG